MPGRLAFFTPLLGCFTLLCCCCCYGFSPHDITKTSALYRWAVITTGSAEASNFSDLLLTELSTTPDLALIEREQLQQVTRELQLSSAFSAEQSAERLRVGALLQADALLFLSITSTPEPTLELVISDCQYGARLRHESYPWNPDKMPLLIGHVQALIRSVRLQYAGGLTKIYGVPGFISHSLLRDYDPLQARYAQLVADVLAQQPGVAVIETEEARAIGREHALANGTPGIRLVPFFIEGDFRVEPRAGTEPTVKLTARVTDGAKTAFTFESGSLPLGKAAQWITTQLAANVLAGLPNSRPLSQEEQEKALIDRADAFARLGAFDRSVPLRESALLLDPDLAPQHFLAAQEYGKLTSMLARTVLNRGTAILAKQQQVVEQLHSPEIENNLARCYQAYQGMAEQTEYLVKKRLVSTKEAMTLLTQCHESSNSVTEVTKLFNYRPIEERPQNLSGIAEVKDAHRRLLLEVCPLIASGIRQDTTLTKDDKALKLLLCYNEITFLATCWMDSDFCAKEYLPVLRKVILTAFPVDGSYVPSLKTLTMDVQLHNSLKPPSSAVDPPALQAFLAGLRASGNKTALAVAQAESSRPMITYFTPETPDPTRDTGALQLKRLNLQFKTPLRTSLTKLEFIPCGKYGELVNTGNQLYWQTAPGVFTEMAVERDGEPYQFYRQMVWDGAHIWGITLHNGLHLLDPSGKILARISAKEGLPTYDTPDTFIGCAIAPGRLFLAGCYGLDFRAWCATVDWKGKGTAPVVTIIHEATEVLPMNPDDFFFRSTADQHRKYALNAHTAFKPSGLQLIDAQGGEQDRVILVGRYGMAEPLLVDLKTMKVRVLDEPIALREFHGFSENGNNVSIVRKDDRYVAAKINLHAEGQPWQQMIHAIPLANPRTALLSYTVNLNGDGPQTFANLTTMGTPLQPGDGWLYFPGTAWYRLNMRTLTMQCLVRENLPPAYAASLQYRYSPMLGMLAWYDRTVYRVSIDEKNIPSK